MIMTDNDWPDKFHPNLAPRDCIRAGMLSGTYFSRTDLISVGEFPVDWFEGLDPDTYSGDRERNEVNMYGVHAGTSQADWERAGWMHSDDPRGWFQWYCRYWRGRRHEDDERQIDRWARFASVERGRWTRTLYGKIRSAGVPVDDGSISPVIRQSLLHWAYLPNEADYGIWLNTR